MRRVIAACLAVSLLLGTVGCGGKAPAPPPPSKDGKAPAKPQTSPIGKPPTPPKPE